MDSLGVCARTVAATRERFVEEGIQGALNEKPRSGRPREFTGREEAKLTLIACSEPPEGRDRWSVRLLADKLVEMEVVDSISRESVRKYLKKGISSRG
jgi:transposase